MLLDAIRRWFAPPRPMMFEPLYCAWCGHEIGYPHEPGCPAIFTDDYEIQVRRKYCEITGLKRQECDCEFCTQRWLA